jgi:hypothetical protein
MTLFPFFPIFLLLALSLLPSDNQLEFFPIFTLNLSPVNYDPVTSALIFSIVTCNLGWFGGAWLHNGPPDES